MRPWSACLPLIALGCGAPPADTGAPVDDAPGTIEASVPLEASADSPRDAAAHDADASAPHDAAPEAPACSKHLTVLFSVGTGAGSLAAHATTGCWTVVDADGAANKSWRKCSTGNWIVENTGAPNWAFDDTNPNDSLSQEQSFLQQCSQGSTGEGFEYMAYRGSWQLLYPATHLKAFFAELHASDDDVDANWPSAYVGNAQLAGHTVYPMINIGPRNDPSPETRIKNDGLAICKTIKDDGYFGVYVGTWDQPMPTNDPRILALASALDACTKK